MATSMTNVTHILSAVERGDPKAAEVLDTFTYFRGIQGGDWGFSAAVGLVKGLVAAILVFSANRVAKALGDEGAF